MNQTSLSLLTRKEVAEMLKVNLSTVARWLKTGVITGYKVGGSIRFKEEEIENFLNDLKPAKVAEKYSNDLAKD